MIHDDQPDPARPRLMLHVRVVSPASLTEQLASRLTTAPGVQNVLVRAGATRTRW
jgi:hypothetical protein